jgi:hypothetical protein
VANDLALCRNCGMTHRFSALVSNLEEDVDLNCPPAGAWRRQEGGKVVIGATHRAIFKGVFLLFFAVGWNAIVSVFVGFAAAATLQRLGVPLPKWWPLRPADSAPVGFLIFLWAFLTPFIFVGLFTLWECLNCFAGRTEVQLEGGQGTLFTGVGALGRRRPFAASDVKDVCIAGQAGRGSDGGAQGKAQIVLATTQKPLRFGARLTAERLQFVAAALRQELVRR